MCLLRDNKDFLILNNCLICLCSSKNTAICNVTELTPYGSYDLVGHVPDGFHREWLKAVPLQKVIRTEPQQLKDNADMAMVVEPVQHPHTGTRAKAQRRQTSMHVKTFLQRAHTWSTKTELWLVLPRLGQTLGCMARRTHWAKIFIIARVLWGFLWGFDSCASIIFLFFFSKSWLILTCRSKSKFCWLDVRCR